MYTTDVRRSINSQLRSHKTIICLRCWIRANAREVVVDEVSYGFEFNGAVS